VLVHLALKRTLECGVETADPDSEFLPEEIQDILDENIFLVRWELSENSIDP